MNILSFFKKIANKPVEIYHACRENKRIKARLSYLGFIDIENLEENLNYLRGLTIFAEKIGITQSFVKTQMRALLTNEDQFGNECLKKALLNTWGKAKGGDFVIMQEVGPDGNFDEEMSCDVDREYEELGSLVSPVRIVTNVDQATGNGTISIVKNPNQIKDEDDKDKPRNTHKSVKSMDELVEKFYSQVDKKLGQMKHFNELMDEICFAMAAAETAEAIGAVKDRIKVSREMLMKAIGLSFMIDPKRAQIAFGRGCVTLEELNAVTNPVRLNHRTI